MANEYRVSQFAVEVLNNGVSNARVSQYAAEVLRSLTGTTTAARRRMIVNS